MVAPPRGGEGGSPGAPPPLRGADPGRILARLLLVVLVGFISVYVFEFVSVYVFAFVSITT